MRKAFLFCVIFIMVMGISFSATAAPGGFISSPSGNVAPVILEFTMDGEDCSAILTVTPFSQRGNLEDIALTEIESAYDDIVDSPNLSVLTPDLEVLAEDAGIPVTNLAVSDLFDISLNNCEHKDGHGNFSIKLKAETLENFVGLMYKHDGEWKVIDGATVSGDEKDVLTFKSDNISPFAVVVNSEGTHVAPPPTGDDVNLGIYFALMLISAVALIIVGGYMKKKES